MKIDSTAAPGGNFTGTYLGPDVVIDGTDNFPVRYLVNDATQREELG